MDLFWDIFGGIGLVLLLVAFILNACKKTRRRTIIYNGLNFIGSTILGIYAYSTSAVVFIALELIWAVIALYFLCSILLEKKSARRGSKKR